MKMSLLKYVFIANNIREKGCILLSEALKENITLVKVDLTCKVDE